MTQEQHPYPYLPPLDPRLITALPIEPRAHHAFLRAPRWRWWKPIVAFVLGAVVWMLVNAALALAGMLVDGVDLIAMATTAKVVLGPWGFLGNNVGVASGIVVAVLVQWLVFGIRPKWLSSVVGGLRWRWLGLCTAIFLPLWLILLGISFVLDGPPEGFMIRPYTALMIVGILLTTPFQAAAEEYLFRGLEQRLVASYFKAETLGWVVATIVSTATFVLLHASDDAWLNLSYVGFGLVGCWLVWRTGGLEAAIAMHVVNNLTSEMVMPFIDFSGLFDRSAGTGDASVLIQLALMAGAAALITWLAKRRGLVRRSAPGADELARATDVARRTLNIGRV